MSLESDIRDIVSEELELYLECGKCYGYGKCYGRGKVYIHSDANSRCVKCDGTGRILSRFGSELRDFLDDYFARRDANRQG